MSLELDDKKQSKGEYLVGISFNPGGNPLVAEIKQRAAELIDVIDTQIAPAAITERQAVERTRCKALAITHIETAAMFAVKAATKPE